MYHLIISRKNCKKKQRQLNSVKSVFEKAGKEFKLHITDLKQDVKDVVSALSSQKGNDIIILGGDGTLHDMINSFVDFENNSVGIIPLGTGNDFAESAHIPQNPVKAAELIVNSEPEYVDFIEFENGLKSLNAFGMGIDVDVLERTYAGKTSGVRNIFTRLS